MARSSVNIVGGKMSGDFLGPADPKIERRLRDSFTGQGLMAHLGAALLQVRRGLVIIRMPFRKELTQ
jgi:acyl-coenzyme A thioesterase PaaI-like protein